MSGAVQVARDQSHMDRALALALEGWGQVAPNPLVGAVLVAEGRIVGEGYHARFGAEHAEVVALREGQEAGTGATLYVTLEPCSHRGKTPPCTEAILRAGIRRVVYACRDPDQRAAGGASLLLEAGLDVRGGVRSMESARLNDSFIWQRLRQEPWVSLKLGLSLDGRIAARPGVRTDITGPETAEYVHRLRAAHDAILVGGRTACIDDPLLTVRLARSPRIPPTRVVLDPNQRWPADGRLVESVEEAPLLVMCLEDAPVQRRAELERRGVEVVSVAGAVAGLALDAVLRHLADRGLNSVMVEGGGRLAAALLAGGHVRKQCLVYAPVVLGPEGVPAMDADPVLDPLDWSVVRRESLGRDTLLELEDRRATDALREVA